MPNLYQLLARINGYDDFPIFDILEAKTNEDGTFTVTVKPQQKKEKENDTL